VCPKCGDRFPPSAPPGFTCANCRGVEHVFAFAVAAYENSGVVRDMVHRFKYRGAHPLRRTLGTLAAEALDEPRLQPVEQWLVVPVPVHFLRRFARQFNQAEEIARVLCGLAGLPFADPLRRSRPTPAQARLDRAGRLRNLSGAFQLRAAARRRGTVSGRRVLLVDDVLTTGATASACATVLTRDGGAEMVAVLTVARG
jgi:ComF family protein